MSILIKGCLLDGKKTDIHIDNGLIKQIAPSIGINADKVIDGNGKAALPSFVNAHTHAAMSLFRGYADDMELMPWLQTKIWPREAKLTSELVYHGARLACLEMIRSGITFFNDMYWHWEGTARAVQESGMRATINAVFIDHLDAEKGKAQIKENERLFEASKEFSSRVQFSLGPHAIYTVSKESLRWASEFSATHGLMIHIHLSETDKEVEDCLEKNGCRPAEYLDRIGFLSGRVVVAHAVWLNDQEIDILGKRGAKVAHNPVSNMKLAVNNVFPYRSLAHAGVPIALGTDGAASNNSLSMFDTMKTAALIQKHHLDDPTALPASEAYKMATAQGFSVFGLDGGTIAEGKIGDLILVDLDTPELVPGHHLISDMVYTANRSCIDAVICDGRLLMENKRVPGEEEVIQGARKAARQLFSD
ncbi:MAG: amidohydrolase [archaeon]